MLPRRVLKPSRAVRAGMLAAVAVSCGLCLSCFSWARPAAGVEPVGQPTAVRESAPEIFYLEDDAGRLVPVPGFRYRDFVDLLRIKEGLPGLPETPPAVLENAVIRGVLPPVTAAAASDGPASTCQITVELAVRQSRSGWVSLPVSLEGLLLTAAPQYRGPGRMLLASAAADEGAGPAAQQAGYRLWLTGPPDQAAEDVQHSITLTGKIAIEASSTHESITLQIPRATASLVELTSPRVDPTVSVQPPSLPPAVERLADGDGSAVTLLGLAGLVKIRLGERQNAAGLETVGPDLTKAVVPQALVESLIRIDGRVAVTEASLQLDNLPADMTTIRITLPPRAALRNVRNPAVLMSLGGTDAQPEAVIRIDRGADGRSRVELECERPIDSTGREPFEPLGFTVADIPQWRQWGRASLVVEGDWQVEWDDIGSNRRIDSPLSVRRPGFIAAFAYDAQPARLPLKVKPRGSRVVIEPEYRYDVLATRVTLDARLRVSVRGAPVSRIVVGLNGWDVDEVGPASVVDSAGVSSAEGKLVIPFVQPLSGDTVVEFRGSLPLSGDVSRVGWRIPSPQADLVGPAAIIIASQSDIELLPDASGVRGLVRQLTPATMRSDTDRVALAYRLDGTDGSFEATRRFLPRRVDATVSVQADIDASDTIVRETIRFDVAHVPLEFITLTVPEAVLQTDTLELRQNGLLLNPDREAEQGDRSEALQKTAGSALETAGAPAALSAPRGRLRAMLAAPLLGMGEVTLQYELRTPAVSAETTVAEDLPLVLPADTRIGRQSITLTTPETLSIEVRGDTWKRDIQAFGSSISRTWTTARPQEAVPLALSARKRSPLGETVVDAAWLQTRLLGDRREDVYRFCVTSSAEQLSFRLPSEFAGPQPTAAALELPVAAALPSDEATIEVRLNGQPLPGAARANGRVVIDLSPRAGERPWLVEVAVSWRKTSRQRKKLPGGIDLGAALPVTITLEPPLFPGGTLQRRFYWELSVGPDEHPINHPSGWTSQQQWEWGAFGLSRVPTVSRNSLAAWFTAAALPTVQTIGSPGNADPSRASVVSVLPVDAPTAGPRFVYSGVGPPQTGRIWVVPTWLLVLSMSGPVLAIGLLGVYQPRLRTTPIVLALVVVASLAAAAWPERAPLVVQAALPGVALALLAAGLESLLGQRSIVSRTAAPAVLVSASSMTQVAPLPSLIIAPTTPPGRERGTVARRDPP